MRTPLRSLVVLGTAIVVIASAGVAQAAPAKVGFASNHASAAALDSYWTPARISAAQPMPAPAGRSATAGPGAPVKAGKPHFVHATEPTVPHTLASEWITNGRLFFTNPGVGDYVCSANVIAAGNRDVIATARHCVMDIGSGRTYTNFRFAPAYNRGNAPYGWWNWRSMGWRVDDTSPGGDNAFIVLATGGNSGAHVQDVVGGSGGGFNWATGSYAHAIGLPASVDYAVWCEGQPYDGPSGGVQIPNCNGLSGGASGGSFIVNYQADGSAVQTASYFGSWGDSYFAYWRDVTYQVYLGAANA
jgi:hypothetical protein